MRSAYNVVGIVVLSCSCFASAQASRPGDGLEEAEASHRVAKRAWNDAHAPRLGIRDRGRDWFEWNEAECKEFCELVVQDKLLHAWRDYELSSQQRERIKQYLDELRVRQLSYLREAIPRLAPTTQRAIDLRARGKSIGTQEVDELRAAHGRIRSAWSQGPLFDRRAIDAAIESMIPLDQVAKKRRRREVSSSQPSYYQPACMSLRYRMFSSEGYHPQLSDLQQSEMCDDWELYVRLFVKCYQLDSSQEESAYSALREATSLREEYIRQLIPERSASTFQSLKSKLEIIPTVDQRNAALQLGSSRGATSRPASAPAR